VIFIFHFSTPEIAQSCAPFSANRFSFFFLVKLV